VTALEELWTSLSSCGIQYRILAVLNAQGPLFIGWGAEWATAVICTDDVRTDNCATGFPKNFAENLFLFKSNVRTVRHWRPDGRTSAASNFHIRLSASGPRGMSFRTAILQHAISISAMRASEPWEADVWTVEVESAISLTDERASGPMLTDVQTVVFELRFLPYLWARPDGKPRRPDGVSIFPYYELGKNLKLIDHWWASGRDTEMSGRMQAGIEASRYSGGSGQKDTSFGWMMLVCLASGRDEHVVRTNGTVDRWGSGRDNTSFGRITENLKSSIFFAVQSLLKMLW
jgi:hypothetical protein